jgi:large subunit ribosomal protein L9
MEVILLERVAKLGQMGEVVRVKDGFARNYLLPRGKALRATEENKGRFEGMKADLQARNVEMRGEAEKAGAQINGKSFVVLRQAAETGHLFGSVSSRDIATLLSEGGYTVTRAQVALDAPIKAIGSFKVPLLLHPEVEFSITVTVARSADEAVRLARGENVTARRGDDDEADVAPAVVEEAFFEPEVVEARAREAKSEEPEQEKSS